MLQPYVRTGVHTVFHREDFTFVATVPLLYESFFDDVSDASYTESLFIYIVNT